MPVLAVAEVKESSVHEGHCGQPRPEPVTRTTPPPMMIRTVTSRAAKVAHRTEEQSSARQPRHRDARMVQLLFPQWGVAA